MAWAAAIAVALLGLATATLGQNTTDPTEGFLADRLGTGNWLEDGIALDAVFDLPVFSPFSLAGCLQAANVTTVTGASGQLYDDARRTLSLFANHYPAAVAYPSNRDQIVAAVICADKYHVEVHPRCGNHANEGETVSTGALTLDLTNMTKVTVERGGLLARVQAGSTVGNAIGSVQLATNYTRTVVGGQRPTVGFSGYVLGGGFGALTRYGGLGSDNIVSMEVVTGAGKVIQVSASQNSDLLWALRGGGGGNVGIVTEFLVRTVNVGPAVTMVAYDTATINSHDMALRITELYQQTFARLDNRFTMRVDGRAEESDIPGGDRIDPGSTIGVDGLFVGTEAECAAALLAAGVQNNDPNELNYLGKFKMYQTEFLRASADGIGWPLPLQYCPTDNPFECPLASIAAAIMDRNVWPDKAFYKYKTMLAGPGAPLPTDAVDLLLRGFDEGISFEMQSLGGFMDQIKPTWTAGGNLHESSQVIILKAPGPFSKLQESYAAALPVLHKATELIHRLSAEYNHNTSGAPTYKAYIGFLDTDIPAFANSSVGYYGDAFDTLRCVKEKYDRRSMFNTPLGYGSANWRTVGGGTCRALLSKASFASVSLSVFLENSMLAEERGAPAPANAGGGRRMLLRE